jgi:hypothetical protein
MTTDFDSYTETRPILEQVMDNYENEEDQYYQQWVEEEIDE